MIDEETIQLAARVLMQAAGPGARVILFGSRARGQADERSDMDLLVIEPSVASPVAEMVRLAEAIAPLGLPVDVVVMSQDRFDYWKDTPNTLAYRVAREGRPYGEVA